MPQTLRRPHGVGGASVASLLAARGGDVEAVTQQLMDSLIGAPYDAASTTSMVVQPEVLQRLLFDVLPLMAQARRVALLDELNALLRLKLWNVRVCREQDLLQQCCDLIANGFGPMRLEAVAMRKCNATALLALLRSSGASRAPVPPAVVRTLAALTRPAPISARVRQRLGNLLITLGAHSMTTAELKTLMCLSLTDVTASHATGAESRRRRWSRGRTSALTVSSAAYTVSAPPSDAIRSADRPAATAAVLRAIAGIARTRHIFYSCNNMTEYPTNECYLIMIR